MVRHFYVVRVCSIVYDLGKEKFITKSWSRMSLSQLEFEVAPFYFPRILGNLT